MTAEVITLFVLGSAFGLGLWKITRQHICYHCGNSCTLIETKKENGKIMHKYKCNICGREFWD